MPLDTDRRETLESLRARIHDLERDGRTPGPGAETLTVAGARGADGDAPRLARTGLHEIGPAGAPDAAAATGFAVAALAGALGQGARPALWVAARGALGETGRPLGHGLARFGCDPARLILAEGRRDADALWAVEEAARAGVLAGVLGEARTLTFTQSRRLAMAAATGETPVILLRPGGATEASAATTRWRIAARPAEPCPHDPDAPGRPRWQAELLRARDGRTGTWDLTFHWPGRDDATLSLDPAARSPDRAAETAPD